MNNQCTEDSFLADVATHVPIHLVLLRACMGY